LPVAKQHAPALPFLAQKWHNAGLPTLPQPSLRGSTPVHNKGNVSGRQDARSDRGSTNSTHGGRIWSMPLLPALEKGQISVAVCVERKQVCQNRSQKELPPLPLLLCPASSWRRISAPRSSRRPPSCRIYGSGVPVPPVYSTTTVHWARNHDGRSPRRACESTGLEDKV
jgi:hypothetical protein